jgi:hypothetical protein
MIFSELFRRTFRCTKDVQAHMVCKFDTVYHCSLFQVVLPNQAEMMFNAVKEKGIPCCYVLYEGTWNYKGHVTRSNVWYITRKMGSLLDISYTD